MLAGIEDGERQAALFAKTLQFGWSVRQLEAAAKNAPEKKEKQRREPLPVEYTELQDRLRAATGLRVTLEGSARKGASCFSTRAKKSSSGCGTGWTGRNAWRGLEDAFLQPCDWKSDGYRMDKGRIKKG